MSHRISHRILSLLAVMVLMLSAAVLGDTLTLTDGTTLSGKVLPQGNRYWIKTGPHDTRFIPKNQVKSWTKDAAAAETPASPSAAPAAPSAPPAPSAPAASVTSSDSETSAAPVSAESPAAAPILAPGGASIPVAAKLGFAETKSKADRADAPLAAVSLWQTFIDNNENSPELPQAKAELEKWKKLDADKAERINGKWIGGEERKKLIAKVKELLKEADALEGKQTLQAVNKLQEAVKLYPNNWEANFELGFFYLCKGGNAQYDKAIQSLESASRLRPNSAATMSNLAIAYNFRRQYEKSVLAAYKAAQLEDSKEIVQNLVNSIAQAPPGMRENNNKVRPIMQEARLLAGKYAIADGKQAWLYVRPKGADAAGSGIDDDSQPGVIGNGSGFIVSADGYILTNTPVAA